MWPSIRSRRTRGKITMEWQFCKLMRYLNWELIGNLISFFHFTNVSQETILWSVRATQLDNDLPHPATQRWSEELTVNPDRVEVETHSLLEAGKYHTHTYILTHTPSFDLIQNQIEYVYYKWKLKTALLVNYRRTSPDFKYINPDSWMPHSTTLSWYPIYGKCHTTYTDYQPRKVYIDISLCTWRWRRLHLIQYCNKYSIFSFFHCLSFFLSPTDDSVAIHVPK